MWASIVAIYTKVLYEPLLGALLYLAAILPFHDLGIAIIVLTVAIKLVLFPLTHRTLKTQQTMKRLEPEIKKIQNDKKNREEQAQKLMELYRAHGINPFSGFLALLVQLPILIALYHVFWRGLAVAPDSVNMVFLGIVSLADPNLGMAALAALSQFWQAKLAIPPHSAKAPRGKDMASMMQKQMMYVFPIMIFFIAMRLPAAVALYWTAMNIFAIVHEAYVRRASDVLLHGKPEHSTS
jgi:YidC/Oxa1 family membrane protein insertase